MSKQKPEGETDSQAHERRVLEKVSNKATRSEKTAWNRKMDKMVNLLAKLRPLEEKIIELHGEKTPIMDDIQEVRNEMVKDCIHPYEYLLLKEDCVHCKFCDKKIRIPDVDTEEEQSDEE